MEQIIELERRITAALDRLAFGLEQTAKQAAVQAEMQAEMQARTLAAPVAEPAQIYRLSDTLAGEPATLSRTIERLEQQHERDLSDQAELLAEVDRLTQLLDSQGLELHRMRHLVVQLREHLRLAREAAMAGASDAELINRALAVEVEALAATRAAELAELDELLSELAPFVQSAEAVPSQTPVVDQAAAQIATGAEPASQQKDTPDA